MILAGDIGGTKTLLALFEKTNNQLVKIQSYKYVSKEYESLEIIINDFLRRSDISPYTAAFGIPGPVFNGVAKSTNLPWNIDEKVLSAVTGIKKIKIVNDLTATAYAIPFLKRNEKIKIKDGNIERHTEQYVVVAPGTGLGQAFLICEGNKKIIIPSEGGHSDFAPTNELETDLYTYLRKKFNRVSYERIISGTGLINVFDFFVEAGYDQFSDETFERMLVEDKATVITDMALKGKDELCMKVVDIFVSVLGSHTGNLVINLMATGGVYLGGGIPHKILPILKEDTFLNSFLNKGRLSDLVESTPVYVINNNDAALHGAARIAFELT